jgi:hypothetical protein
MAQCLLADRDEMSNLYKWLSIDASHQVSVNFPKAVYDRHGKVLFLIGWNKYIYSPLKLGGTVNCYFIWMMYGRYCTKFPYFVPIVQLIWPIQAALACYWPSKKSSNGKLCINLSQNNMAGEQHMLIPLTSNFWCGLCCSSFLFSVLGFLSCFSSFCVNCEQDLLCISQIK